MRDLLCVLGLALALAACSGSESVQKDADANIPVDTISDGFSPDLEMIVPVCGDGICDEAKESCGTCPEDCGQCVAECGDGECNGDETCETCPDDCGTCTAECGDGECNGDETCETCPGDCGNCAAECGDGECNGEETCETCPDDCGPCACGDGECGDDEDCASCPEDCGVCECGDEQCSADETCESCPADCGECECGDETCNGDETCESCPEDCGECECGDGTCNGDETCESCPEDCTECDPYCGDGTIQEELNEQCDDGNNVPDDGCDEACQVEPQEAQPGDLFITEIMKTPLVVDDSVGEWFEVYNASDVEVDLNGWQLQDDGIDEHTIFSYDGVVVPAGGFAVLGRSADPAANGGVEVDYVYSNFNLSNKDDEIILLVYGVEIDRVAYDNGETFPDTPGYALSLSPAAFDGTSNDAGEAWCSAPIEFGDGDFGSPGEANPDCSDEETCGNGNCGEGEDCASCPADCGDCCGNGQCDNEETCASCPEDCGQCCGNGACDFGENCNLCPDDCGECCGDGQCLDDETCQTCPADCGDCCGNGQCEANLAENCTTCPDDCGECCGDGTCAADENCNVCPDDCGACCPNGQCDFGETCTTCPLDCGACCGNGQCDNGETCETCPNDCGACPAGGWCELSGTQGDEVNCLISLAAEESQSPKATGLEFVMNFDSTKVSFDRFHDEMCFGDSCFPWDTPPNGTLQPSGHTVSYQEQSAGVIKVVIYHGSQPATALTDAYLSGQNVVGDAEVVELVFTLGQNIASNSAVPVTLSGLKGTDATANSLSVTQEDDLLVSAASGVNPSCGDGQCNGAETCDTCPGDCGACPPECGDGECNGSETCTTCPADCGVCPECGDGQCNGAETCDTCPGDCGACPAGGWCELSGNQGDEVTCDINLAAESSQSPKATGLEFIIGFDDGKVSFDRFHDEMCFGDTCFPWDTPPNGTLQPTGHTISYQEQSAGSVKVVIYHGSQPATALTDAYVSGQNVVGDAQIVQLVFTLDKNVSANSPEAVDLSGLKGTDANANPLTVTMPDDVLITSAQ